MFDILTMDDKYDNILFDILKEAKTIPQFFDVIFGFLFRRTDFYHITNDPNLGVGLPPGVAESYLRQAFMKYVKAAKVIESPETPVPKITDNVVVAEENELVYEREEIVETETEAEAETEIESETKQATFDSYNGAVHENYSWSQSITDVDIQIKIPEKTTSKELTVNVTPTKIRVKLKNSNESLLEGDLCHKCKHQDTIWSIDGCILQIHIEKIQEIWWNCLVTSEEKIDLTKMDCSRPFHELSEEAQAKIEELTWNQERKRQGLPTSDQLKLEKTLKKAWNVEGSPFTGEYHPSKVILN